MVFPFRLPPPVCLDFLLFFLPRRRSRSTDFAVGIFRIPLGCLLLCLSPYLTDFYQVPARSVSPPSSNRTPPDSLLLTTPRLSVGPPPSSIFPPKLYRVLPPPSGIGNSGYGKPAFEVLFPSPRSPPPLTRPPRSPPPLPSFFWLFLFGIFCLCLAP